MSKQFFVRANGGIAVLAEHFPVVFVLEGRQPHKPLKIGIKEDIAAAGVMPTEDIKPALRLYVRRLMYQRALAAGGCRYSLDGKPCGEVTAEQAAGAAIVAAHIEAEVQTKGTADITARKADKPRTVSKVFLDDEHRGPEDFADALPSASEPTVKRLGLADLKRAAQERRAQSRAYVQGAMVRNEGE
jgi:sRNA-binding protein